MKKKKTNILRLSKALHQEAHFKLCLKSRANFCNHFIGDDQRCDSCEDRHGHSGTVPDICYVCFILNTPHGPFDY